MIGQRIGRLHPHREARRGRHRGRLPRNQAAAFVATSPSSSSPKRWPRTRRSWRGSSVRRGPRLAQPSPHRRDLRDRGDRRAARAGDGAGSGEELATASRAGRSRSKRRCASRSDRRGARGGARPGRHPPRPQAGEHQAAAAATASAGAGQPPRLRPRQGAQAEPRIAADRPHALADAVAGGDADGNDPRHRRLHDPSRPARCRRSPRRHLVVRRDPLEMLAGPPRVPRRHRGGHAGQGDRARARLVAAPGDDAAAIRACSSAAWSRARASAAGDRRRAPGARGDMANLSRPLSGSSPVAAADAGTRNAAGVTALAPARAVGIAAAPPRPRPRSPSCLRGNAPAQ